MGLFVDSFSTAAHSSDRPPCCPLGASERLKGLFKHVDFFHYFLKSCRVVTYQGVDCHKQIVTEKNMISLHKSYSTYISISLSTEKAVK